MSQDLAWTVIGFTTMAFGHQSEVRDNLKAEPSSSKAKSLLSYPKPYRKSVSRIFTGDLVRKLIEDVYSGILESETWVTLT